MSPSKKHLWSLALSFFIIICYPTAIDTAIAQQSNPKEAKDNTSSWRTYRFVIPSSPIWEIRFPPSFKCMESRTGPCNPANRDDSGRVILKDSSFTLCSEDFIDDVPIPAAYCIFIKSARWSSSDDFFNYLEKQISQEKSQDVLTKRKIKLSSERVMLRVETFSDGSYFEHYFTEIDKSQYLRITVRKYKPEEARKRAQEIEAIISTFELMD
jgi:hypothetical protein